MANANSTSTEATDSGRRVGISREVESETVPICVVSFPTEEKAEFGFSFREHDSPYRNDIVAAVREVITAHKKQKPTGDEDAEKLPLDIGTIWEGIARELSSRGYQVEQLPKSDFELCIEFDASTGRAIGRQKPLHRFAVVNEDVTSDMTRSISAIFENQANDLASSMQNALANNRPHEALGALKADLDGLRAAQSGPTHALLDALLAIDVSSLSRDDRKTVRKARVVASTRLRQHETSGDEAQAILTEFAPELTPPAIADLKMAVATGLLEKQMTETACAIYRELLDTPDALSPSNRGWAYRNMSLAMSQKHANAAAFAELSADAFLEAGDRDGAAASLMRLARCAVHEAPERALEALNRAIALLDTSSSLSRDRLAGALHTRALWLSKLAKHQQAFEDANRAASLREGLLGAESERASSLFFASHEAETLQLASKAAALRQEAEQLAKAIGDSQLQLATRVQALSSRFDRAQADELEADAKKVGLTEGAAQIRVLIACHDTTLDTSARFRMIEESIRIITASSSDPDALHPAQLAMATQLEAAGELDGAATWYERILSGEPFDLEAGSRYVNVLWRLERWAAAASYLERLIEQYGEMPGRLYGLGRSLYESGEVSRAIPPLRKCVKLCSPDLPVRGHAERYLNMALDQGGVPPATPERASIAPLSARDFERAIVEFSRFIKREKRMRFWESRDEKRSWVSRPERQAQDLLHTFLQGSLGDDVQVFEELSSGAGRLDLLLSLRGGLTIIVELKMCGGGYSTNYALDGVEQVLHYMAAREKNLGYLLVFDGRMREFGTGIDEMSTEGPRTVFTRFVDVRPSVKTDHA